MSLKDNLGWIVAVVFFLLFLIVVATRDAGACPPCSSPTPSPTVAPTPPSECSSIVFDNVIVGTPAGDGLRGTSGNDLIIGNGGGDSIRGRGGDDCIVGNDAGDDLRGGSGDDIILGNGAGDRIRGNSGDDTCYVPSLNQSSVKSCETVI